MGKKDRRIHMYRTGLAAFRAWLPEVVPGMPEAVDARPAETVA
jgi:hypothetical protein